MLLSPAPRLSIMSGSRTRQRFFYQTEFFSGELRNKPHIVLKNCTTKMQFFKPATEVLTVQLGENLDVDFTCIARNAKHETKTPSRSTWSVLISVITQSARKTERAKRNQANLSNLIKMRAIKSNFYERAAHFCLRHAPQRESDLAIWFLRGKSRYCAHSRLNLRGRFSYEI